MFLDMSRAMENTMPSIQQANGYRPVILLVEDNAADLRLAQEVLKETQLDHELLIARDGEEAMLILRREGSHAAARRPDLVLLDLNLPRKHGREVLAEIKADAGLKTIPVLILSTSKADSDVRGCEISSTLIDVPAFSTPSLLGSVARTLTASVTGSIALSMDVSLPTNVRPGKSLVVALISRPARSEVR